MALPAVIKKEQQEVAYRVYVTDTLKALIGAQDRYIDWIKQKPVDNRNGEEIAAGVIRASGLKIRPKEVSDN